MGKQELASKKSTISLLGISFLNNCNGTLFCAEYVIKPKSTGYARINVVTADGGFKDSCILEVTSNKVTGITIDKDVITLKKDSNPLRLRD